MLQKVRAEITECRRHIVVETSSLADTTKVGVKACAVQATLRVIQTKPVWRHSDTLSQWDELLTQINNACDKARYPIGTNAWDAIVGRIGHSELYSWLYAWRMQLIRHLLLVSRTSKFQAIYKRIICTLSEVCAHEFTENVDRAAVAFDQSCLTRGAAILAVNCLVDQLQHWCPVYSCEF